ncbi:AaceriACL135Wp [[Ashbya] aceris (nom. inval.)]|nr:AaceriACL135Wp [[Ashbya] aceris (nom. inval.)]
MTEEKFAQTSETSTLDELKRAKLAAPAESRSLRQTQSGTDQEAQSVDWNYDGKHEGIRLKKDLQARHVSMIAIGGALGTGLLIGTGSSLMRAGPGSILIAYSIMGWVVFTVMSCLGEMAAYIPLDGFTSYATRYADPALGFAVGWAYLFKYLVLTPNQLTAGALVIQFWIPAARVNPGVWITVVLVVIVVINTVGVRFFGEFEFWLSSFKVLVMLCVMILLLVLALGGGPTHDRLGFRYWQNPGAFKEYQKGDTHIEGGLGKFVAFLSVFVYALFAYLGTELCGIVAAECRDPRRNVPRAIKLTLYRIVVFYLVTIFFLGMCVAYNDPLLMQASSANVSAAASPYVVAIENAAIPVLPNLFNACVLTFVFSACNSDLYVGSRSLYGLAIDGKAPKLFARTNKWGVPYNALACCTLFCCLAYMSVSNSAKTAFGYFVNVTSIFGLMSWVSILITYICFDRAFRAQGIPKSTLSYVAPCQPYAGWVALCFCIFVALIKNFDAFIGKKVDIPTFITGYVGLPIYIFCFIGYKIVHKTKWIRSEDVDLFTFKEAIDLEEEECIRERALMKEQLANSGLTWRKLYENVLGWVF